MKVVSGVLLGVSLAVAFTGVAIAEDKYELKFVSEYPDKHPTVKNAFLPWIEEVKELSKGRLDITFFNPNALVPARQVWTAVGAGVADIAASPAHWAHGTLKLAPVIQLPMMFNGAEAGSLTTWELSQASPEWQKEYRQVKVLWHWSSALFEVHTKDKLVRTLDDLKGKKIIGWNPQIRNLIKALGANPVEVTPHDSYMALERGMADGIFCPIAPMKAYKITDVMYKHTIVDLMSDPFYAVMNKKKWDSLPADLQKILDDTTGERMARISGKSLDEGSIADINWMRENGHEFYVLPAEEKAKWQKKVNFIHEDWVKTMSRKGIRNAQKIHDMTIELGQKYSSETVGGYSE
ncbi:MAG: TRAP transporter substrate-binding protein, partial [Desulfobacterales bacterium]|nr:TRAP transporter substrate-binding protein [Desulfobacterales bacterium]MDX2512976.1 TRAP transporter substrate-binding protein [Desulfobacterales bacterium]